MNPTKKYYYLSIFSPYFLITIFRCLLENYNQQAAFYKVKPFPWK